MAFVRVDEARTWIAERGLHHCPQIPIVALADDPYLCFDLSHVLDEDTILSSPAVTEVDSKTVTVSDESVSPDGKSVSFKVTGMTPAGNFTLRLSCSLSTGTTQTLSVQGTLKVV